MVRMPRVARRVLMGHRAKGRKAKVAAGVDVGVGAAVEVVVEVVVAEVVAIVLGRRLPLSPAAD
jgi:hypothetical protein